MSAYVPRLGRSVRIAAPAAVGLYGSGAGPSVRIRGPVVIVDAYLSAAVRVSVAALAGAVGIRNASAAVVDVAVAIHFFRLLN